MNIGVPSWDQFGVFLAVMRGGSLSAAARALRVTQPTARRQIENLEQALGVILFTRSKGGLQPTATAISLLPYAETMASTAAAGIRSASSGGSLGAGIVRITCSEIVGIEVLPKILVNIHRANPIIAIELNATNATEDLVRRDSDIAIRMTRPRQSALVAKRVATVQVGLFASVEYLAQREAPGKLSQLLTHHTIIGDDQRRSIIDALAINGVQLEKSDFSFRSDSDLVQLAALRAGVGIGICQSSIAARDPNLKRVLPDLHFDLEMWLVKHEDLRSEPRVRIMFDSIAAALAVEYH